MTKFKTIFILPCAMDVKALALLDKQQEFLPWPLTAHVTPTHQHGQSPAVPHSAETDSSHRNECQKQEMSATRPELILPRLKPYLFQRVSRLKHQFERSNHLAAKSKEAREYYMLNCFKQLRTRCLRSHLIVKSYNL